MKKIAIIFILILLTGCVSKNTDIKHTPDKYEGFLFEYNGVEIKLNENAAGLTDKLGEPSEYFEAPSCAFEGLDKFYYYSSFEINTYELNDTDYISQIILKDDSISTPEGIYIGDGIDKAKGVYGEIYTEENNFYTYTKGKTKLQFITDNGLITGIAYIAITN